MLSDAESISATMPLDSIVQSTMDVSEEVTSKAEDDETTRVTVKSNSESIVSRLKFSINRILGYDDFSITEGRSNTTPGLTQVGLVLGCLNTEDDGSRLQHQFQSSVKSSGYGRVNSGNGADEIEEEDDEGDDDEEEAMSTERDDEQDVLVGKMQPKIDSSASSSSPSSSSLVTRTALIVSGGGSDDHHPVSSSPSSSSVPGPQRLSWLQCTRYKPPKLPRTKKSKEGSKKRKLGRNPRVPFTQHQVAVLEQKFRHTHYLSSVDVAELSATLNLTENRVKIWFQNRRARERREKDGSPLGGGGGGGSAGGCHSSASTAVCIKDKLFLGASTVGVDDIDFKSHDIDGKSLSRPVGVTGGSGVIPSLHAVMRAKGAASNYLTLAEQLELRPYFSTTCLGSSSTPHTSSVAIFENRMTSYSTSTWPTPVSGMRMTMPTADIFAHLSSSVIGRRYSSPFGPINFLR